MKQALSAIIRCFCLGAVITISGCTSFLGEEDFLKSIGGIKNCPECVVHIRVYQEGNQYRSATGVLIVGRKVLTAGHLFDGSHQRMEVIFGGRGEHLEQLDAASGGKIRITYYSKPDYAIIHGLDIPEWAHPAKIAPSGPLTGEIVTSVGLEAPAAVRARSAKVLGRSKDKRVFHMAVLAQPGDSGGPVFNARGELVGINQGIGNIISVATQKHGYMVYSTKESAPATFVVDVTRLKVR